MKKAYVKISFNTTKKINDKLEKLVDESDDFRVNKSTLINEILEKYLKERAEI